MIQTLQDKEHVIKTAPSKFDLMTAFFMKLLGMHRIPVNFSVALETTEGIFERNIEVVINTLSWEDGSGESWCFEGYVKKTGSSESAGWTGKKVKGWFKTTDRNGWIKLSLPAKSQAASARKVILTQRTDSAHIQAKVENDPGVWGTGKSVPEAIGNMVQTHPQEFGLEIGEIERK